MKANSKNCLLVWALLVSFFSTYAQDQCAPVGWATQNGGTTGGGNTTPVTVTNISDLTTRANASGAKVIYVSGTMGSGVGTRVRVSANTTIIGMPGARLNGGFDIRGNNVIIRNMIVRGPGSVDVDGVDCISIDGAGTTNVWIDHCDIADGQDGNMDITNGASFIAVTWTKFHYTSASQNHQFCSLIGNSDSKTSDRGRLKVTLMYNWFTTGAVERMPRVRFGQVHVVNNLFDSPQADYCVRAGVEADILVESNYFNGVNDPIDLFENNFTAVTARNNVFNNVSGNTSGSGTSFTPPYSLAIASAANVLSLVSASCGAGATMPSPTACGCSGGTNFTLTTAVNPSAGGSISRNPNASTYAPGTVVTLTATPASGFTFTNWSGGASGTNPTTTVTMNANTSVTANFTNSTGTMYTLTTTVNPSNGGSVSRSPNASSYSPGTVVTLTATPASGFTFTNWSGGASGSSTTTTVTMNANTSVTANFTTSTGGGTTVRIDDKSGTGIGYCSANGSRQNTYSGADGGYYINLSNSSGQGITWAVNAPTAGTYNLKWRYSNAGTQSATTARVLVNGVQVIASVAFPKTAAWSTWTTTASVPVTLVAGANKIRLETTVSSEFAMIDWIEITGNNPTEAGCGLPVGGRLMTQNDTEVLYDQAPVVLPNPSTGASIVRFAISQPHKVLIRLYASDGKLVNTLVNRDFAAGQYTLPVDYKGLQHGVYFISVSYGGKQHMLQHMFIK